MKKNDTNPFINGNGIYLRELRESDLLGPWYTWFNDSDVTVYQNKGIYPNTIELQKKYYDFLLNDSNEVVFAIIEKSSNKHIGNVGLHHINWLHRNAEIGIVIGDKLAWGKKYGKEAWSLVTEYGFKFLNLHKIYAHIIEENIASIKSAENAGYLKDGLIRDFIYKRGKYLNAFYYSILLSDFDKQL